MKRHLSFVISLMFLAACSTEKSEKTAEAPQGQSRPAASAPAPVEAPAPARKPAFRPVEPKVARTAQKAPAPAPLPPAPASQPVVAQPMPTPPVPQPVQQVVATPAPAPPPPPAPPEPKKVTIPAGTQITVRMIDSIDSDTGHVGQTFKASMDSDLKVDNDVVIARGSNVFLKLVDVQSAGKMTGRSEVKVQLDRLVVGQNSYTVQSNTYSQEAKSQGVKTAKTVGVGTAIGAIIGGIAGGGKGAVIGAGAGAGGGTAVEAVQKSEQVHIASESALVFRLENPLEVTIVPGSSTPTKNRFVPVPQR